LLGGYNDTNSKFTDTPNVSNSSQRDNGGFIGAYGSYQAGAFAIDMLFKADFFTAHRTSIVRASSTMPIPAISISRSNAFRSSVPDERDQWCGVRDGSIGLIG
jgi:hypothetical protein